MFDWLIGCIAGRRSLAYRTWTSSKDSSALLGSSGVRITDFTVHSTLFFTGWKTLQENLDYIPRTTLLWCATEILIDCLISGAKARGWWYLYSVCDGYALCRFTSALWLAPYDLSATVGWTTVPISNFILRLHTSGYRAWVWEGAHGERGALTYNGGLWAAEPPPRSRDRAPGQGLTPFVSRSRPIVLKFILHKKISLDVWGRHVPIRSASMPTRLRHR